MRVTIPTASRLTCEAPNGFKLNGEPLLLPVYTGISVIHPGGIDHVMLHDFGMLAKTSYNAPAGIGHGADIFDFPENWKAALVCEPRRAWFAISGANLNPLSHKWSVTVTEWLEDAEGKPFPVPKIVDIGPSAPGETPYTNLGRCADGKFFFPKASALFFAFEVWLPAAAAPAAAPV